MSVSVLAATVNTVNGSENAPVYGIYKTGGEAEAVYNIDITWGSLEFTYTGAGKGTWNPNTHSYDGATPGKWSCANGADEIIVANNSNTGVNIALSYTAKTGYTSIRGTFTETSGTANDGILSLASAVGTTVENAPSATAKLVLSGALASGTVSQAIGTVTVTLS